MDDVHTPVITVARERASTSEDEREIVLAGGIRARLNPVSASLIEEVTSRIKDPKPPKVWIEEKGREEENPDDPDYIAALDETRRKRGVAAMDALLMFGIELIDEVPRDGKWIKQLEYLARRGAIDLSGYDLDNEIDREFLYKRFVASNAEVISKVSRLSGVVTPEEVALAEESFPSHKAR